MNSKPELLIKRIETISARFKICNLEDPDGEEAFNLTHPISRLLVEIAGEMNLKMDSPEMIDLGRKGLGIY